VIIVALWLAVLLVALDQTIIATAIPRITDHFNSVQDIGWYGSVSSTAFVFGEVFIRIAVRLIF
jgi:MFS family permease